MSTNVINLSNEAQQHMVKALNAVMADTFSLYFKTHSYHWNVTGPNFYSLHNLFEEQYTEMWNALDEIAERIRTLNNPAPISSKVLVEQAQVKEASATTANDMIKDLADSQKILISTLQQALEVAQKEGDEVTVGFLTDRLNIHEKSYWMLKSSIG